MLMSVVSRYQLGWLTLCGLSRALTSHSRAWLGVVVPGIRLDVKTSYFPGLNPSWCTVISESKALEKRAHMEAAVHSWGS